MSDWVPISTAENKETGENCAAPHSIKSSVIEDTGFIKMDFLGLKTLSIINSVVRQMREEAPGIEIDVDVLDIEDPATYRLYCDGRTIGTFQFESAGIKIIANCNLLLSRYLIAMQAFYRPVRMDLSSLFIDRKQGRKPVRV